MTDARLSAKKFEDFKWFTKLNLISDESIVDGKRAMVIRVADSAKPFPKARLAALIESGDIRVEKSGTALHIFPQV